MHESLWEVTFSLNHVIAEFFWNAVFAIGVYVFAKAKALSKIHKYVDDKHDIKHNKY